MFLRVYGILRGSHIVVMAHSVFCGVKGSLEGSKRDLRDSRESLRGLRVSKTSKEVQGDPRGVQMVTIGSKKVLVCQSRT